MFTTRGCTSAPAHLCHLPIFAVESDPVFRRALAGDGIDTGGGQ
jgi:hypothetical protein